MLRKASARTEKRTGVSSQPSTPSDVRKNISTGIPTEKSVSMTMRVLGFCTDEVSGFLISSFSWTPDAACKIVDRRETRMEPVPPGKPEEHY